MFVLCIIMTGGIVLVASQHGIQLDDSQVLDGIRPKYVRPDPLVNMHPWWAILPLSTARATMYLGLMEERTPNMTFLSELCSDQSNTEALIEARNQIASAHQERMESHTFEEEGDCDFPVVLDLFSGSGRIPFEALRLGAQAYALDFNPVAYVIQQCTIRYPQLFGSADETQVGSAQDGTWAGLQAEVEYWSEWVQQRVQTEIQRYYPQIKSGSIVDDGNNEVTPWYYLWAHTIQCGSCGATVPLIRTPWLTKHRSPVVALKPDLKKKVYSVVAADKREEVGFSPKANVRRGTFTCPFCGTIMEPDTLCGQLSQDSASLQLLGVVAFTEEGRRTFLYGAQQTDHLPNLSTLPDLVEQICSDHGMPLLDEQLVGFHEGLAKCGFQRYRDLYTPRQLLTLFTYVKGIHDAYGEMHRRRMSHERVEAVTAYLGLLLDHLAWRNNKLTRYSIAGRVQPPTLVLSRTFPYRFVEFNPFADTTHLMPYTRQVSRAIQYAQSLPRPAEVFCRSATDLPFESESFDAVVTDPPYYDAVQYADLSNFFYVWLKRSIGHLYPDVFSGSLVDSKEDISAVLKREEGERQAAYAKYEAQMEDALAEAARVLKTGSLLTVIVPSFRSESLQLFIGIAQRVGLELFDAKRIPTRGISLHKHSSEHHQLLLMFRKNRVVKELPEAGVNAATVLERVNQGHSALYTGMVEILQEYVDQADLEPFLPRTYRGTFEQRLSEYVANSADPRSVLEDFLGLVQARRVARELNLQMPDDSNLRRGALDAILTYLGFRVPEAPEEGVFAVIKAIEAAQQDIQLADDKPQLEAILSSCMRQVELTLKRAILEWTHLLYGASRNEFLKWLETTDYLNRKPLELATFGELMGLFYRLSRAVHDSSLVANGQVMGRIFPYSTGKTQRQVEKVVSLRNTVTHNKEGYLDVTSVFEMKHDFQKALQAAKDALEELVKRNALPLIARPVAETRDVFNRLSVKLIMEDGSERRAYLTHPLILGKNYVLFPSNSNPTPVDPPMILLEDALETDIQ